MVAAMLKDAPDLEAKALFEWLCDDNVTDLPRNFILGQVADAAQRTFDPMTRNQLLLETVFRRPSDLKPPGLFHIVELFRRGS